MHLIHSGCSLSNDAVLAFNATSVCLLLTKIVVNERSDLAKKIRIFILSAIDFLVIHGRFIVLLSCLYTFLELIIK